jgi:hypothetical protein
VLPAAIELVGAGGHSLIWRLPTSLLNLPVRSAICLGSGDPNLDTCLTPEKRNRWVYWRVVAAQIYLLGVALDGIGFGPPKKSPHLQKQGGDF